jgi:hypothetical protein
MRRILLACALLAPLLSCAGDDEAAGIAGSSTPPAGTAAPGEVVGSVLWDPVATPRREALAPARAACARHGLDARTTGETQSGAQVTTRYVCE